MYMGAGIDKYNPRTVAIGKNSKGIPMGVDSMKRRLHMFPRKNIDMSSQHQGTLTICTSNL
jgi:hypothetical protein